MERKNIRFSILVPVYNAQEYLDACIQSVLHQTYDNYELILVNDGSEDKSGEICNIYAKEYDNIFAYHKENAGQLHTREYAIEKATGDYYVFLDSDDTLRSHALETIRNKITEYSCDCVIYQWERVLNGKVVSPAPKFTDTVITDKRELYKKCFLSSEYNSLCRKATKASVFQKDADYAKDYTVRYGEDLIQSIAVLKNSKKIVFIDDVLYNYTVNPNSVLQSITYSNNRDVGFTAYHRVMKFLESENVWNEEDYIQFKVYCSYLLCGELLSICKHNVPTREKRETFKVLRNAAFYKEYLSQAKNVEAALGKRAYIFRLFRKEQDAILVFLLNAYWLLQKVKNSKG